MGVSQPLAGISPMPAATAPVIDRSGRESLRELIEQIGREVTAPMTSALERVNAFAASGRIDRAGLRALRDELECARRIALSAQQIGRVASGRVRQRAQRLNLTTMLHDALAQRRRETASRGIELRQRLQAAQVIADASLCAVLLRALLDWSFEHARSHIEFGIDVTSWPERARLACRFSYIPPDELATRPAQPGSLDTVTWQLLQRLSQALGLALQRDDGGGATQLTLEFPRTVGEGLTLLDPGEHGGAANSQPMVGRHVLVIASRRETRNAVRDTLRPMGLMVDYVASMDEAREFCSTGLPHAIVFEAALAGEKLRVLRAQWQREVPSLAYIEIAEQGRDLEVSDLGGQRTARIGRDVLPSALGRALASELARCG
ncbi:MAG TPA: hypothetical protein PLB41_10870 [Rubrivivax sp.]|nr:hypothetical protein [Rubrivivax sp.]HPO19814.1 hypothetical protein [Rubrivivax sp.]